MAAADYELKTACDDDETVELSQELMPSRTASPRFGRAVVAGSVALVGCIVVAASWTAGPRQEALRQRLGGSTIIEGKSELAPDEGEFAEEPCLCVFDIDRTLTGKQGWAGQCLQDQQFDGVPDTAYAHGTLVLSEMALRLDETFCHLCYKGVVSVGDASGEDSAERQLLLQHLGGTMYTRSDWWQPIYGNPATKARTSLVVSAQDGSKHEVVKSMLEWWSSDQKVTVKPENVYFFDDRADNVKAFEGSGFNARQISCASRGPSEWQGMWEGQIGGCGGAISEVVQAQGVVLCG